MKPVKIEESFIDQLTKCSWWLDKHFNIGTIWFSMLYILISVIFLNVPKAFNSLAQIEDFNAVVISFLIDVVVDSAAFLLFLRMNIYLADIHDGLESVLVNTKLNPNPNKYKIWILGCRYSCILPLIFNVFGIISFFSMITIILIMGPSFYILCIDPIPPGLKKKILEEKEVWKLEPVTSL